MFGGRLIFIAVLVSLLGCITADDPTCDKHTPVGVMAQIYHCCKHPDGHNAIADKCANATGFKLPSATDDSLLDLSPENLLKGSCFSECVFNESRFINNGTVNIDSIRTAIKNDHSQDQEYVTEILAAFEMCHSKAEEKQAALLKSNYVSQHVKDKCDPMPGVIFSCVIKNFFKNCPSARWTNNAQCNEGKEYLNKCEKKFG